MIFIMVGFLIIIYSLQHYKKGLCIYLAFKLLLVTNITLISIPGVPLLTLEDFMNIFFVLYFIFINRSNKIRDPKFGIPWQLAFIGLSISFLLSSIFSFAGFWSEISAFIKFLFGNILIIWVVWENIQTKKDFEFVFKLITIIIFVSCIYGLFEYSIETNPLQSYESTLNNDPSRVINFVYTTSSRGYRINSIFEHAIGAGINWSLYLGFVLYCTINNKKKLPLCTLTIATSILCVICILLTKMRSPLVFVSILCFGSLNFTKKKTYILAIGVVVIISTFLIIIDKSSNVLQVFLSLFQSLTTSSVGGSSLEMRIDQINAALNIMRLNPVLGLGTKYQSTISRSIYGNILGSEGLLLYILPCFGIFGLLNYAYYFWISIAKLPKYFKTKQLSFLFLAYFITYLISSLPGMKISLFYLFAFYLIKSSDKYKSYFGPRKVSYKNGKLMKFF